MQSLAPPDPSSGNKGKRSLSSLSIGTLSLLHDTHGVHSSRPSTASASSRSSPHRLGSSLQWKEKQAETVARRWHGGHLAEGASKRKGRYHSASASRSRNSSSYSSSRKTNKWIACIQSMRSQLRARRPAKVTPAILLHQSEQRAQTLEFVNGHLPLPDTLSKADCELVLSWLVHMATEASHPVTRHLSFALFVDLVTLDLRLLRVLRFALDHDLIDMSLLPIELYLLGTGDAHSSRLQTVAVRLLMVLERTGFPLAFLSRRSYQFWIDNRDPEVLLGDNTTFITPYTDLSIALDPADLFDGARCCATKGDAGVLLHGQLLVPPAYTYTGQSMTVGEIRLVVEYRSSSLDAGVDVSFLQVPYLSNNLMRLESSSKSSSSSSSSSTLLPFESAGVFSYNVRRKIGRKLIRSLRMEESLEKTIRVVPSSTGTNLHYFVCSQGTSDILITDISFRDPEANNTRIQASTKAKEQRSSSEEDVIAHEDAEEIQSDAKGGNGPRGRGARARAELQRTKRGHHHSTHDIHRQNYLNIVLRDDLSTEEMLDELALHLDKLEEDVRAMNEDARRELLLEEGHDDGQLQVSVDQDDVKRITVDPEGGVDGSEDNDSTRQMKEALARKQKRRRLLKMYAKLAGAARGFETETVVDELLDAIAVVQSSASVADSMFAGLTRQAQHKFEDKQVAAARKEYNTMRHATEIYRGILGRLLDDIAPLSETTVSIRMRGDVDTS